MTASPQSTTRLGYTWKNCEDEPIRIPGSIQRHGFLLLLDPTNRQVVGVSQNVEEFLDIPYSLVMGTPLDALLDREILSALKSLTSSNDSGLQTYLGSFPLRGKLYSVVTHCVDKERVLEFELMDRIVSPEMANQVFTNFVSKLTNLRSEQELCDALAEQVQNLTGFNRVMLYRFDEHGHGIVLSEVSDGVLPSYLDLRFPASDIPQQARELYVLNTVRIIPDAMYTPSPLHGLAQRPLANLDLSMSILRSVSPIHIEYMRNMGTLSSMSISLLCEGKLWGLVSGHHAEPRMVPYLLRSACDLLAKLVCTQLINLRASSSLKTMVQFHAVQRQVLVQMAAEKNYLAAIAGQMEDVVQITNASGAALVVEGQCTLYGQTPNAAEVAKLANWMDRRPELELFHSRHLGNEIPDAADFSSVASGLIAIRISYVRQTYLMWFRPEVVRTVQWAGELKDPANKQDILNPRKSFDVWKELVRGRSNPWSEMEIESASEFRATVTTIGLKRAEEAVQLGEARFLKLTHALPNLVWTTDEDAQITYVNERWLEQGLSSHGRWYEQERISPEDKRRCESLWTFAASSGTPLELEIRLRTPKDDERWNLVHMVPYLRADGTPGGWVGTCTDLTDRRQREATLRMSEKLALTGRMTSVIAHEINNPLEAMTNLLYLLREHVRDESARSYIQLAEMELQRISGITKQTLRWSKESGPKPQYGNASSLFDEVLRLFAGKIRNHDVNVTVEPGEGARFYGTAGQLSQVLANLVSNAIQAIPVGGRIWLGSRADGDMMEIVVRDDGCGMNEETLRNLFQPFYSTKGDLGNGLGLYISHEIVERNGGSLDVQSQLGRGTEVRVRLPAHAPSA